MDAVTATAARANLYKIIDQVNEESEPLIITGMRGNAVLVAEDDWRALQETIALTSIPGMTRTILDAHKAGIENASEEQTILILRMWTHYQ